MCHSDFNQNTYNYWKIVYLQCSVKQTLYLLYNFSISNSCLTPNQWSEELMKYGGIMRLYPQWMFINTTLASRSRPQIALLQLHQLLTCCVPMKLMVQCWLLMEQCNGEWSFYSLMETERQGWWPNPIEPNFETYINNKRIWTCVKFLLLSYGRSTSVSAGKKSLIPPKWN